MRPSRLVWALIALTLLMAPDAEAQGTLADYQRATGLRERHESLAINVPGPATWIDNRKATATGSRRSASKTFDLLVIPGAGHGPGGAYGERKRYDFFVQHVLGVMPPAWNAVADKTPPGRSRRTGPGPPVARLRRRPAGSALRPAQQEGFRCSAGTRRWHSLSPLR